MSDPRDINRGPYGPRRVDDTAAWTIVVLGILIVTAFAYTMGGDRPTAGTADTFLSRGDRALAPLPANPSETMPHLGR
jgi:hypothetical protein